MAAKLLPAMQFIPALTPKYSEPRHLAPFVALFERIQRGEQLRAVVSVPPGHEKTETLSHCFVWLLKQRPELRGLYASYGQRLSNKKSRRIRQLALRAGVKLDKKAASASDWRTGVEEGGLWATSAGGAVTGERLDLILLDDLVKDRVTAENALSRERTYEWVTNDVGSREEPGCSSILIMHRWHVDDVAGRLVRDGWEEISLPAINENGEPLLPERFSLSVLEKRRTLMGDYGFESLYMQRPRPRGSAVFRDVHTYETAPEDLVKAIGVDFAYSTKTHADYSVAVVLGVRDGVYYVLDVVRMQVTAPQFQAELERLRRAHPGAELVGYVSGTERGTLDMMRVQGLDIVARAALADKFTRAQPVAAAWNAGKVLVPARRTPWRDPFVSEFAGFTGIRDRHDDQVDALAGAFDLLRVTEDDDDILVIPRGRDALTSRPQKDPWLRDLIRSRHQARLQ